MTHHLWYTFSQKLSWQQAQHFNSGREHVMIVMIEALHYGRYMRLNSRSR